MIRSIPGYSTKNICSAIYLLILLGFISCTHDGNPREDSVPKQGPEQGIKANLSNPEEIKKYLLLQERVAWGKLQSGQSHLYQEKDFD